MFRKLTDKIYVAPQIECADVGEAATQGVTLINLGEGETLAGLERVAEREGEDEDE